MYLYVQRQYYKLQGIVSGGGFNSSEGCMPYSIQSPAAASLNDTPTPTCVKQCRPDYPKTYAEDKHYGLLVSLLHSLVFFYLNLQETYHVPTYGKKRKLTLQLYTCFENRALLLRYCIFCKSGLKYLKFVKFSLCFFFNNCKNIS